MGCSDIHGVSTENIDQSGFNPEFTCSADYGFECEQKAPCHPCPLIKARLWCSCDQVREEITTQAVTTTPIPNPIRCHDFHDSIWSAVTCSNACWRVSYFDFKLGNVRNDYGCMDETYCDSLYQREECYRPDALDSGRVCIQCCKSNFCNAEQFTEAQMRNISGISTSSQNRILVPSLTLIFSIIICNSKVFY